MNYYHVSAEQCSNEIIASKLSLPCRQKQCSASFRKSAQEKQSKKEDKVQDAEMLCRWLI